MAVVTVDSALGNRYQSIWVCRTASPMTESDARLGSVRRFRGRQNNDAARRNKGAKCNEEGRQRPMKKSFLYLSRLQVFTSDFGENVVVPNVS